MMAVLVGTTVLLTVGGLLALAVRELVRRGRAAPRPPAAADSAGAGPPVEAWPVVLREGGSILALETVQDGYALCRWLGADGRIVRGRFPVEQLYACRPIVRPADRPA